MADPFAGWRDVEDRWAGKTFDTDEQTEASFLTADASGIIRDAAPTIDTRIAAGLVDSDVVLAIVAAMVKRKMSNPQNLRQFSTSIDDHQESGTYDASASVVELYLTDREAKRIGARVQGRAFTISPGIPV